DDRQPPAVGLRPGELERTGKVVEAEDLRSPRGTVLVPVGPEREQALQLGAELLEDAAHVLRRPTPHRDGSFAARPRRPDLAAEPGAQRHDVDGDAHAFPASAASISSTTSGAGSTARRRSSAARPPRRPSA